MDKSQLVELVKTLDAEEKAFVLELSTLSFFNQDRMRDQVGPLLKICLNHDWNHDDGNMAKEAIYATLFPGQNFIDGKLDKVMVEAHKVLRAGLLILQYFGDNNEFKQGIDFSEVLRKKNLDTRFHQILSRLQKFQEEAAYKNEVYLQRQFQLDYAIHLDDCFHNQKKGDLNITNVIQSLDLHYHINRISVLNRFLLQQKEANIAISKVVKSSLAQEPIREEYLLECPILNIHYVIHGILQKEPPAVTDVQLLFTILRENEGQIDQDSLVEFYTYLRNFCILIINNDPENEEIHVVMHELYKDNLERGFLLYDGKMHPSRYLSIYDNAAKVKKNDWALDFIEKYKDVIIGENESQDIYRFNKARYFFDVGKYRDCLDHIPATFPFIDYLIIAKRVELKALYELNDDLFSYKLDTFKMYLSRTSHKLFSEQQRLLHTNFANFLTQIISAPPGDHKRADRIIDRLHAKKQTAEWRWLLAKAQELKQK